MKVLIKGRLTDVGEPQNFGSGGFRKQQVVVTTEDKYDNEMPITLVKDACGEMDAHIGALVEVRCYLGARKWQDRYFIELKYAGFDVKESAPGTHTNDARPPGFIPQPDGLDIPF